MSNGIIFNCSGLLDTLNILIEQTNEVYKNQNITGLPYVPHLMVSLVFGSVLFMGALQMYLLKNTKDIKQRLEYRVSPSLPILGVIDNEEAHV